MRPDVLLSLSTNGVGDKGLLRSLMRYIYIWDTESAKYSSSKLLVNAMLGY